MDENPYRPPEADLTLAEDEERRRARFKDPTVLARWTTWSLWAQIGIALIALASGALEYQLLGDFKAGAYATEAAATAAATANDLRQGAVGIAQMIVFIGSGVLILMWIHRANHNARQLGAADMRFTPGWAVGWYFVPILNLVRPYQAMKEIWKASARPDDWKDVRAPALLPWWWALYLGAGALGNVSFRMALRADGIDEIIYANVATLIADFEGIALSLVFLVIVKRVHGMQMGHHRAGAGA